MDGWMDGQKDREGREHCANGSWGKKMNINAGSTTNEIKMKNAYYDCEIEVCYS